MSAVARRLSWLGSRPEGRAAGIAALSGAVLALPFLAGISMLDEGALVHIADRIASGEVLYRDVATGVMPGSFYLQALLFLVFGRSLLVGRLLMIVLFAFASALVFLLARRVTTRTVALAAALSFSAVSVHYWRFPGYSAQAIVLIFVTLLFALAYVDTGKSRWLVLTGLGIGFTILFKQNYGTFASLGVAAGLAAAAPTRWRAARDVATAAIAAALPIAVVAILFAAAGAGADFWRSTVGVPLRVPYTVFTRPWPALLETPEPRILRDVVFYLPFEELAVDGRDWLLGRSRLAIALVRATYYLPPLFLLGILLLWLRRRRQRSKDADIGALYLGCSAFLFLGVFPRVDAHHLFMALAPCFPLAAWALGSSPRPLARRGAIAGATLSLSLSLASQVAAVAASQPEEVRDAFLEHPRARVFLERWQASEIRRQLAAIDERVEADEPIFVAPSAPMYYFLTGRPNPTRYPLILPGALDEDEVVRTLDAAPVRYALVSDVAFEHFPFPLVAPSVWDYVSRHFRPAEGAGWDVAPFAPYLYIRGPRREPPVDVIRFTSLSETEDDPDYREVYRLIEPPLSPTPPYQTVSFDDWRNEDPYRVEWQSTYLEPSLVIRAPGGWRKVLVSWEVPAEAGLVFEFSCAIDPWAWAGWGEGQGGIVEAWVRPSPEPGEGRRVFLDWLNPRDEPEDRKWRRAKIELSSFVATRRAIVTLVVGPAPTFLAADATVAFSNVRIVSKGAHSPLAPPRTVRLDQETARRMLAFGVEDIPIFQEATRRYPELGSAHIALSEVAGSLGQNDLALSSARQAVSVAPEYAYFWIRLGQELQVASEREAAIDAIETAIRIEPENADYHAALAAAHLASPDELTEAGASARAALRLDPDNTWALTLLATAAIRAGIPGEAEAAAERAVALAPNAAWPRLTLAASRLASGRTDEALSTLEQTGYLDMDAGARAELARQFLEAGQAARARAEALASIEQEPRSLGGLTVLGHAEVALRNWPDAVRAWKEVVELDRKNSSALVQLARSLARAGEAGEARAALAEARELAADDPSRVREVAIVLDEVGATDEALAAWRRLLALAPEGELKDDARRRLGAPSPPR